MQDLDNSNVGKLLGKQTDYPRYYDPTILVKEPRINNRKYLNLDEKLPFVGYDVWNAWEISTLTGNGLPVTAIAKIVYPANSEFIVESKSLKLYLNSFNMSRMGETPVIALQQLCDLAKSDLTNLLNTPVTVSLFKATEMTPFPRYWSIQADHYGWYNIDEVGVNDFPVLEISCYTENPNLLRFKVPHDGVKFIGPSQCKEQRLWSTLLKSNCRVTHQPDNGDVYIYMVSDNPVDERSLLRYIISFRDENHFHEEVVECIYKRLWDKFLPHKLLVYGSYVRRGGCCIHPLRCSEESLVPEELIRPSAPFVKGPRE